MPDFKYHVFFCTNQRADGSDCCQRFDAQAMRDYMKQACKALGLDGSVGVRINSAGCLDHCAKGPVIVVYPEGVWYSYIDKEDIDEIIQSHLIDHQVVDRLCV